ncbi:hypothetical protein ACIBG8_49405 [Nonomuraea sp. NPDC050556]|uniref:hypothetical protein n=1 Tax=Nonomuraea sp. NPDC050556 TaxID=3364369 RepID=UPI003790CF6D
MCDLNSEESRDVVEALNEISTLAGQLGTHSASIEQTAFMDHENLAALLTDLRDRTDRTLAWVIAKPQQHHAM